MSAQVGDFYVSSMGTYWEVTERFETAEESPWAKLYESSPAAVFPMVRLTPLCSVYAGGAPIPCLCPVNALFPSFVLIDSRVGRAEKAKIEAEDQERKKNGEAVPY